jgi:hypothetical protein
LLKISQIKIVISSLTFLLLYGCYSFVGGNVPDYIKTIVIPTVNDQSNYGVPEYKDFLTEEILKNFRSDGTLKVVENQGDAQLNVAIISINESISQVNPGELEKERKVQVTCKVEYFDNVKKKMFWEKEFTNYSFYNLSDGIIGRNETIRTILKSSAEDILLSVISNW